MDMLAVFPPQVPGPLQLLQEPALGIRDVPGRTGGTDSSTAWRHPHGHAAPFDACAGNRTQSVPTTRHSHEL